MTSETINNFYLFQANVVAEEDIGKIWNAINKQRKLQDEICEEIKKLKWGKFQDDDNNGDRISLLESKVKALEQAEKKKNIEIQDAFQKNGELFFGNHCKARSQNVCTWRCTEQAGCKDEGT